MCASIGKLVALMKAANNITSLVKARNSYCINWQLSQASCAFLAHASSPT
jgi:hypothetical protein